MVGGDPFQLPPADEIILTASPGEWRAATLRGGQVWGLDWHWPDRPNIVGAVFAVRVIRLAPELRGAFVATDSQGSEGFLDLSRARGRALHEGQRLLAQVTRMPEDGKRLTLTPAIRLVGRYMIYTPMHAGVSASRQLPRAAAGPLQGMALRALLPDEGAIVRAAASHLSATPDLLLAELDRHRADWQALRQATGLGLLRDARPLPEALLLQRPGTGPLTVTAGDARAHAAVRAASRTWVPSEPVTVSLDTADPFAAHGGDDAMASALEAELPLSSGGTLWLEHTRACWTADVDSGRAQGQAGAVRLLANREAAVELARQVRLRQAAGAVVADFLRMDGRAEQAAVIQHLRAAFAEDPAVLHFNPAFDPLSLYAFSRSHIAPPLSSRLAGGGLSQAVLAGLRVLVRNTLAEPHRRLALHVSPAAATASAALPLAIAEARDQLGQAPQIVADPALPRTGHAVRPVE